MGRRRRGWRFPTIFANAFGGAVVEGGVSRDSAARRFGVSIASAVRWVARFKARGEISPAPTGGDRRSGRIEAHRDYLLGLIRRQPDMTLLEIQERLIANCGERFSSSVLWRFFDRRDIRPVCKGFDRARRVISLLQRIWLRRLPPSQDGDTRVPVLIKLSASSAVF